MACSDEEIADASADVVAASEEEGRTARHSYGVSPVTLTAVDAVMWESSCSRGLGRRGAMHDRGALGVHFGDAPVACDVRPGRQPPMPVLDSGGSSMNSAPASSRTVCPTSSQMMPGPAMPAFRRSG